MAYLTKCPLCGRDRVSSECTSCPNCTYNIAADLRQKEQRKEQEEKKNMHENWKKNSLCQKCGNDKFTLTGSISRKYIRCTKCDWYIMKYDEGDNYKYHNCTQSEWFGYEFEMPNSEKWKVDGCCAYCGGNFGGLLKTKCMLCGRRKNYQTY